MIGRRMPEAARPRRSAVESVIVGLVGTWLVVGCWIWAAGEIAGWVAHGHWPRVGLLAGPSIVVHLVERPREPRAAWPAAAAHDLSGPGLLYGCAGALLAAAATLGLLGRGWWQRRPVGPGTPRPPRTAGRSPTRTPAGRSDSHLGRLWRGTQWVGAGARWARGRDLDPLTAPSGRRDASRRLVIGTAVDSFRGRRLLATEAGHSLLVIGPTQSGKTSGLAVPAILEWAGPVVATSVKDDLAAHTISWRTRLGPSWVFDPTGHSGVEPGSSWSPLAGSWDWSAAQRVAAWLVDATPSRSGMSDAAFWYAAASKQLSPLLLAANRCGAGMAAVVRWTNLGDFDEPMGVLELSGEEDALIALQACEGRDERIRSSVQTTLETVLAPFEDPVVAESTSANRPDGIDISTLLDSTGTLYLCGPSHEQHRVQGVFAALVSSVVDAAVRQVNVTRRPLDPPLLVVLDEAANIAPIRELDTLASTAAGFGIQLVTVCQDLAQLASRYGEDKARTITNNHRAKLVLSGVSDLGTLDLVSGLAGEQAVPEETISRDMNDGRRTRTSAIAFRRLAPTDEIRRIQPGCGVLVYGHLRPVRVRLRPWFQDRRLRARVAAGEAGDRRHDASESRP